MNLNASGNDGRQKLTIMTTPVHLLHLEDSAADARLIQHQLEVSGLLCDIVRTVNEQEFTKALTEQTFDLILCDYRLPGYDGVAALELAQHLHPHTPVVMISGALGEEEAVRCLHLGATDYLLKQRLERLPNAIRRALNAAAEKRQRQLAEAELRDSEARFRQLAEYSSEGFWFVALHPERMLYVSPAMEKIWGNAADHFLAAARYWLSAIHSEDQPRVQAAWEAFVADQSPRFDEEYRLLRPDASLRWVLHSGTAIRDEGGAIIRLSGVVRDVTERQQTATLMQRAQRLESLGALASSVAHDLHNTLAPIEMGLGLLRMQAAESSSLLDIMETSANRGIHMVQQLLTFAESVQGNRLPVQPLQLLEEITSIIQATLPATIHLRISVEQHLPTVNGDAVQLQQVLLHLCANARDAMPTGGNLTVSVESAEIDATYADLIADVKPGLYVVWRIADTGTGVPPEVIDHIFEPFFSTKEGEQSAGIGLSTVFGIVNGHGGFVRVYSKPGQGSTFTVYLPASPGSVLPKVAASTDSPFSGNGETILVVDDDASVRTILSALLQVFNFQIITAADGTTALIEVASRRTELRAVITDLNMPHMDGLTFLRAFKRLLPEAGVIVISGRLEDNEVEEFQALGINAIVEKPFTKEKLVTALRTMF
ncbi:MAG: response regulator [Acidobacteria bacterium]|nr:response regulator [Acidobacteriota bacterium]